MIRGRPLETSPLLRVAVRIYGADEVTLNGALVFEEIGTPVQ